MNPDMDKLFVYENLLAAEDHLLELIATAESSEEKEAFKTMYGTVVFLRDNVMPEEKDSRFHCLVKHLASAHEGLIEVNKVERSDDSGRNRELCYDLLKQAIKNLWDRDIATCERCKEDGRV